MNLFEPTDSINEVAARVADGKRTVLFGDTSAKTRWIVALTEAVPQALAVRVPCSLDQVESVVFDIALQCGAKHVREIGDCLEKHQSDPSLVLHRLDGLIGNRPVLADDLDLIGCAADWEFQHAFQPSWHTLKAWLEKRSLVSTQTLEPADDLGGAKVFRAMLRPRQQDAFDTKTIWRVVGEDPDRYQLAVARHQLGIDSDADLRSGTLLWDVWQALPSDIARTVALLSAHGRPIERSLFQALGLVPVEAIDGALETLVVEHARGQIWVAAPWQRECPALQRQHSRRELHVQLAGAFAQIALGDLRAHPRAVLEAHRHYAEVPDFAKARKFALYGSASLFDVARALSGEEEFAQAAQAYRAILQLDADLRTGQSEGIGSRPRAYALHYQHYNDYRAQLESLPETLDGYRESVALWPENALFRSRTVRALFLERSTSAAVKALNQAMREVPNHPNKDRVLVGRTVDRLLRRQRIGEAALVWGTTRARSPDMVAIFSQLLRAMADGWMTERLWAPGGELVFHKPEAIRVAKAGNDFACSTLDITGRGPAPSDAISDTIQRLRTEIGQLLGALTHALEPERRVRKRVLLSTVDLVASRLLSTGSATWVIGNLQKRDGLLVLATDDGQEFEIDESIREGLSEERLSRLAKVSTGSAGEPAGPVVFLDEPLARDPEAVWREWRDRMNLDA